MNLPIFYGSYPWGALCIDEDGSENEYCDINGKYSDGERRMRADNFGRPQ
jgi:hypothetical protein